VILAWSCRCGSVEESTSGPRFSAPRWGTRTPSRRTILHNTIISVKNSPLHGNFLHTPAESPLRTCLTLTSRSSGSDGPADFYRACLVPSVEESQYSTICRPWHLPAPCLNDELHHFVRFFVVANFQIRGSGSMSDQYIMSDSAATALIGVPRHQPLRLPTA
jgi:hypothetical protein